MTCDSDRGTNRSYVWIVPEYLGVSFSNGLCGRLHLGGVLGSGPIPLGMVRLLLGVGGDGDARDAWSDRHRQAFLDSR